jgi:hypothetical protein
MWYPWKEGVQMGFFDVFGARQTGSADVTERKPKPEGWVSRLKEAAKTISPGPRRGDSPGKFTVWKAAQPQPTIQVQPEYTPPKEHHYMPKGLMAPPPWYKDRWIVGAFVVVLLSALAFLLIR